MFHITLPRLDGQFEGEMESNYRLYSLNEDCKQAVVGIFLLLLPALVTAYNDYVIYGHSAFLYFLLTIRGIFIAYGIALIIYLHHIKKPAIFDLNIFVWGMLGMAMSTFISSTRPANQLGHAVNDIILLIILYLGIPYKLRYRLILTTLYTAGSVFSLFIVRDSLLPTFIFTTLFSLVFANATGLIVSHRLYSFRRSQYASHIAEEKAREKLKKLAATDNLTGVLNRSAFLRQAEKELARFKRYGKPFSLLYMDIDGFKQINDSFGHAAGDEVLLKLAEVISTQIRQSDIVGRLGGDEFSVLLIETPLDTAVEIAERIRGNCCSVQISHDSGTEIIFTVSLGASMSYDDDSLDQIISRADAAMYKSKFCGRNQTNKA